MVKGRTQYDIAVIGAGILGLAIAMRLTEKFPNKKIIVIEKESDVACHQTGHNSGVIHAGIYYSPGSQKANFCSEGSKLLRKFADKHDIKYEMCGKVIVASSQDQVPILNDFYKRGTDNGALGLEIIDGNRLNELEPHVAGVKAIWSPNTGIIDFKEVTSKYCLIMKENGGDIIFDSSVEKKKQLYLKLRLICSKIFLFHLGDEVGMINNSHIYDNCDYVWRTFCANKYFKDENLSCLPMGHKTGIYHRKEIQDRKYRWSFIGTPHKSSRHDLLFQFSKIKPSFIFRTKKFNDKKIIEANEMSEILSSTHFMPCPNGFVHPESYRLYEALECQCIPIIEDSYKYYDRLLPGNPFLKVNKWLDAKEIITNWTREQITKKREQCSFWWNQYKLNLQEEISKKIGL